MIIIFRPDCPFVDACMCLDQRLYVTGEKNICNQPVLLVSLLNKGKVVKNATFLFWSEMTRDNFFFFFYNFQLQLVLFLASIKF